jgi:UPF0148 protein
MMDSMISSDEDNEGKSEMKDAVSFLLRGGSLLGEPCAICNGVQIKYEGEIICINCGKREPSDEVTSKTSSQQHVVSAGDQIRKHPSSLSSLDFEKQIEERIAEQFKILKSESNDLNNERQRIELIGMYLDLLDKFRNYQKRIQK